MLKVTESRKIMQDIIHKQQEIEEYRDMVKQLLEAMRVSDLRKCPERFVKNLHFYSLKGMRATNQTFKML